MGIFNLPDNYVIFDSQENPFLGSRRHIYHAGTDIKAPIYRDSRLTELRANPMIVDDCGRFDCCYLIEGLYRMVVIDKELLSADDVYVGPNDTLGILRGFLTVEALLADATMLYGSNVCGFQATPRDAINVWALNQNYEIADPTVTDHHLITVGGVKLYVAPNADGYHVEAFGAVGDGATDDTAPIQAAIDVAKGTANPKAAIAGVSEKFGAVRLGGKTYYVSTVLDCTSDTNFGLTISGDSTSAIKIVTDYDGALLTHGQRFTISDMTLSQTGTLDTGIEVHAPTRQSFFGVMERIGVSGFKYGVLCRYSLSDAYRSVTFHNCVCGIRLPRNDDMENPANPDAVAGWNLQGGWFHNQITFDTVLVGHGEVGIWASCMGATFNNVTCQRQDSDGTANVVLLAGYHGTGVWLDGGTDAGTGGGKDFNCSMVSLYTEFSRVALRATDLRPVDIIGAFFQGGSQAKPYEALIIADNAQITVNGATGQGWWTNDVRLTGGAVVTDNISAAGGVADVEAWVRFCPQEGRIQESFPVYSYDLTGNTNVVTLPFTVPNSGISRVSIVGVYNGVN